MVKTKRIALYIVLVLMIVTIIFSIKNPGLNGLTGMATKDGDSKVDRDVLKALDQNDTVDVIIILKEPKVNEAQISEQSDAKQEVLDEKKDKINQVQEEVLQTIDYVNKSDVQNESQQSTNPITGLFVSESEPDLELKYQYETVSALAGTVTADGLNELKKNNNVVRITKNKFYQADLQQSVPLINATAVHGMQVNGINITGTGETICVIDTGVDYNHPDLGGCFGPGCRVIGGHDYVNNDSDPVDDNGHGTHVAGIAAANGNINGVAPDAKLVAVKVLNNNGGGYTEDLIAGINWCVNNSITFNISVITMSLGNSSPYSTYCDAYDLGLTSEINNAVGTGIFVDASSGNDGLANHIYPPSCISNVSAVGSIDKSENLASFSNIASILDLLAPGVSINSSVPTLLSCPGCNHSTISGYDQLSGTSMAAPHVAGAAALVHQYFKLLNNDSIPPEFTRELLKKGGKILSVSRSGHSYNFSRVDVLGAINQITTSINHSENSIKDNSGKGKIVFGSGVNLTPASFAFIITNNSIYLNSTRYPSLNVSANLTIYSLPFHKTPIILKDGHICTDCIGIFYDGQNFTFSVTGFSNYSAGANSQLQIFDQTDNGTLAYAFKNISFFANYTNITSGAPISTGNCSINFSDGVNGDFTNTSGLFVYVRNFTSSGPPYQYNVTCSDSNFETLNSTNSITVWPGCGLNASNQDWIIENATVTCENETLYFNNQTLIVGANATFILIGSSLILNSSDSSENIVINETSNISIYNSTIVSKIAPAKLFYLYIYGGAFVNNITLNSSRIFFYGNNNYSVNKILSNDYIYFNNSFSNLITDINTSSYIYFGSLSNNTVLNSYFGSIAYFDGNSKNNMINSSFNTAYFRDSSDTYFNYSIITAGLRGYTAPTIRGYVDMPATGSVMTGSSNRYYPVLVRYTNGSPAISKQVNITNGSTVIWSGTTDSEGIVYPNITFGIAAYNNNTPYFNISVNPTKDIGFLTDTPIIFYLNAQSNVYLNLPLNNTNFTTLNSFTEINFSFNFTDDNSTNNCSIYIDGVLNQTNDTTDNNTITNFITNVSAGNHQWYVNCSDGQYASLSETRNFTVLQDLPPAINLNLPGNDTQINNTNTITLNFTAIDDINTTLSCDLYVNGIFNQTNSSVANGSITNFIIPVSLGSYNWSVNCTDGYSSNVSEIWYFTINDTLPPAVNLNLPANGLFTYSNSTEFNWTAIDNYDTLLSCNLTIDGNVNASYITTTNGTPMTYPVLDIGLGLHWWNVTCWDSSNNANTSATWNFTILSNLPPAITLNNPTDNSTVYNRTIPFNFTPTDDLNNTLICSIYIDSLLNQTNYTSINSTPTVFRINLTGTHDWYINCSDGDLFNVSETRNVTAIYCGDFVANGPEECDNSDLRNETCASRGYSLGTLSCTASCTYTGCSNPGGGTGGGGGGGPITPPPKKNITNETPEKPSNKTPDVIPTTKKIPPKIESPAAGILPVVNIEASPKNAGVLMLTGIILIAAWILIFPILYFGRKCFAEENVIERLIKEERLGSFRKLFVTKEVYDKYKKILEEKEKRCNLEPIKLKKNYYRDVARIKTEFDIPEELAKLILAAKKGYWNVILTKEHISDRLRKKFKHIKFENPFRE